MNLHINIKIEGIRYTPIRYYLTGGKYEYKLKRYEMDDDSTIEDSDIGSVLALVEGKDFSVNLQSACPFPPIWP